MPATLVLSYLVALFAAQSSASGLYPKNSPVLQVDARTYDKLIAKSNYTSIVEFYAPWCGHCKNLKPAYEKAASALSGYAKVAAINCDDESNKPFCGSMGVQGFPTLKIVKPSKKTGGKPIVEDYNGARTAKAISEVVTDKIPNHVSRLKDADLEEWLSKTERPKIIFFTEKGLVSSLVKALAIDFLGSIDVAQIRSSEKEATSKFGVEIFPQVYIVPGVDQTPEQYDGDLKKGALKDFMSKFATPNPEYPSAQPQAKSSSSKKGAEQKAKPNSGKKSEANEEGGCPAGHKGPNPHTPPSKKKETSASTESSEPEPTSESAAPVIAEPEATPTPTLQSLVDETALHKSCLSPRMGTCVLAVLSPAADEDASVLQGLSDLAHKHILRRSKLFPFYSVPSTNAAAQTLISRLEAKSVGDANAIVVAVNTKKGWWTQYTGSGLGQSELETWVDNIRFGDFKRQKLPEVIIKEEQEKLDKATKKNAKEGHEEL